MKRFLSDKSGEITQSYIRSMTAACKKADGINLAQGVCNLGVPAEVEKGVAEAISAGYNTYTPYSGIPEFRNAIAEKMYDFNGLKCDPEREIIVSAGSTGSFYCTCMALLNPGDEVILFEPYYGYHVNMIKAVDAVPRFVRMQAPDWSFKLEDIEKVITDRTRAIVICTPGNPSGKVYTEQEIRGIGELAIKYDFLIFTDEIYEYFVYDDCTHLSPGTIQEIADRTVTISGYSKTFSITGWRIGYSVCCEELAQPIGHMNDLVYVCAPAPLQMGVAAGINQLPDSYYEDLCDQFLVNRAKICTALSDAGLKPIVPQGSYYVLADASSLPGDTSEAKAMYLLDKTGVAGVPGSAFYSDEGGDNLIRFCYAKPDEDLDEACHRISAL